ncbi:MAG TPA: hypothetical protein VNF74_02525 [Terriglobales bacterium]|nr:hypothetical protein [Terriglobales bacterium]
MRLTPLCLSAALLLTAAAAQTRPAARKENQQDRIAQGIQSGQLTTRETATLEFKQAREGGKRSVDSAT